MALVDIIKYEGDNSTFVWKHPCEDFNSLTQLVVHESQEAVFFMNGQALDLFGAGRYTLETQNIPKLGKILNRTTGDNTPFHCEVYFINKTVQMAMKWGTDSKVRYIDPESGVPLELGASGSMNMQVADSRKLLIKLVGTMSGIAWESEKDGFTKSIQSSFRPVISTAVKTTLSSVIKSLGINILEVDEHLNEIALELHKKISPEFEEYGLSIPQFYLTTVVLPEDDPNFKRIRELYTISLQKRMIHADMDIRTTRAQAEAEAQARAEAEAQAQQDEEADSEEDVQYDENGDEIVNTDEDAAEDDTEYVDEDTDTTDGENDDTQYDEDGNAITGDETEDTNTDDAEANTDADYDNSGDTSEDTSSDSGSFSSYSGSGSSVVDYATQFVGNPYVWGGTSLTNGADCSGFVQSVYANFGVSLPRTSYEQQNAGTEVSYADAQPGDLICYGGHVAIYMGNGQIVHASNSQDGIKISNDATYRTIVSVRRLV